MAQIVFLYFLGVIFYPSLWSYPDWNIWWHSDVDDIIFDRGLFSIVDPFHSFHVSSPTHYKGHTLDRVFTLGLNINVICSKHILLSDHGSILGNLSRYLTLSLITHVVSSWILNSFTSVKFPLLLI